MRPKGRRHTVCEFYCEYSGNLTYGSSRKNFEAHFLTMFEL